MDFPSARLKELYLKPRFYTPAVNLQNIPERARFVFKCDNQDYETHVGLSNNRLESIAFGHLNSKNTTSQAQPDLRQAVVIGQIEGLFRMIVQLKSKPQWMGLGARDLENFLRDENHVPLSFNELHALNQNEIEAIQRGLLGAVERLQLKNLVEPAVAKLSSWTDLHKVGMACEKLLDHLNASFFALDGGYVTLAGLEKNLLVVEFHGHCKSCRGQEISLQAVESKLRDSFPFFNQTKLVALITGKR